MADPNAPAPSVEAGGATIPKLGLGTWQNTGAQCAETVRTALQMGYRHVDTAQAYDNEAMVGDGIAAAGVDREDVFLTTKVWRSNLRGDEVVASVEDSIDRLGVGYVDLLLIHWPHPRVPVAETLEAMADLRADGLVSHLGVANFTRSGLEEAMEATEAPLVTDQVLYNPLADQSDLVSFCAGTDLALTAYSPLARGAVLGNDVLAGIGERYGKTAAQVALRWLLQQDGVVAIPKATGPTHLEENLDVFDFSLTDGEMERIDGLRPGFGQRVRNLAPAVMRRLPF
ncbi:MAG: aldo/keto reductase [Halobacteriales archaeon]